MVSEIETHMVGSLSGRQSYWSNAYCLALPNSISQLHNVLNVKLLKAYKGSIVPPPDPIELDNELEYEVSYILHHCRYGRNKWLEFLISFVGYDTSHN